MTDNVDYDKIDDLSIDGEVLSAIKELSNATRRLMNECEDDNLAPEIKIVASHSIQLAMRDLRYINKVMQSSVGENMQDKMAVVQHPDGKSKLMVERVNKSTRKDLDREGLLMAVNKIAAENKHRVNIDTGELCDIHESRNRLYQKCFRFEPRWTELKEIGIDDDEFCVKSWETSVKVSAGGRL